MTVQATLAFDMAASAWIGVVMLVYMALIVAALAVAHSQGLLSLGCRVDRKVDRLLCWVGGIDGEEGE